MSIPANIFTCLGREYHLSDLRQLDPVEWTISKNARAGDFVIFYLIAPIKSVVGFGRVMKNPWFEVNSNWQEKYFSEIDDLVIFDEDRFLSNSELRNLFPEFRWLLQPRTSVAIPNQIINPFWELLQERK